MDPQTHPDPFADAASHGIQRVIQVASAVATGTQALAYLRKDRARKNAQLDERARREYAAQLRAEQAAARASVAAVSDPAWLKNADLGQAARAWGALLPYADPATPWHDPSAATVMRRAEERLRVLHPTAMARYDRLRSEGATPADAMRQAAPMFAYPPQAHDPPYTPARSLTRPSPAAAPAPEPAETQAPPARAPQPWQQDFPLPVGDVLAATANKDSATPTPAEPADAPRVARRPRDSRQP